MFCIVICISITTEKEKEKNTYDSISKLYSDKIIVLMFIIFLICMNYFFI